MSDHGHHGGHHDHPHSHAHPEHHDAPDASGHGDPFTWDPDQARGGGMTHGDARWLVWLGLAVLLTGALLWWFGTH